MMEIVWTDPTHDDLDDIKNYIKRNSEYYAKVFTARLVASVDILETFPEIGRIVPELNIPTIREIIYKNYRIIYKLKKENNQILILTVIQGSRDLENIDKSSWNLS